MTGLSLITCVTVILASCDGFRIFVSIRDPAKSKVQCTSLKQTITDSIISAGITFFADHPRGNNTFDPNSIEPFTPSVLIEKYYGKEASAVQFTEAIMTVVYSAEKVTEKRRDRNDMRRNLYSYIKAGSYEYARKRSGELFRNIIEEYVASTQEWQVWGCVVESKIFDVLEALEVEYYRILNEVGDVKFGQFLSLGIGSTLAFCIDDTGSMSGEIEAAKKRAQVIVEYSRGTLDAPQDFVLVPFNDPNVGPVTVTNEAELYHKALGKLYAHGGGDWEELAMRGIQLAIENSRPGSIIYVITDAPAKDYYLQDTVIAQARQKSIAVTFLLTNKLGGCISTAKYKKCRDLYEHIARETGGKTLVLGRSDIFRATDIVQQSAKQGIATLKIVEFKGSKKSPHHVLNFHVDSSLAELQIQTQGRCQNIYASLPGQSSHVKLNERRYGGIWAGAVDLTKLNKTWIGEWKLGVDVDSSTCEVQIQAKTTMGFVFTLFSKHNNITDDEFKLLQGNPSVDSTIAVTLDGYGMDEMRVNEGESVHLKCYGKNGDLLHEVKLHSKNGKELKHIFDSIVSQFEPFHIMVEGKDPSGHRYQRMHTAVITPSHVRIECDLSKLVVVAGARLSTNITITNNGKKDRLVVSTSDEHSVSSFRDGKSPTWTIGAKTTIVKNLQLSVPENLQDGTAVPITIVVRGKSKGSFQHAKCTFVVGQKKRPRIDSFSVKTVINARFAETVVTSTVTNNAAVGREAEFDMLLPKAAFITGIRIELQNETIHGVVEEKKKAQIIYQRAKEIGTVAGHVAARDSSSRSYRTSMFVEAGQKVRFVLTYQEFLIRTRGRYEYAVILKPDQPIKSLSIDVDISEGTPLTFVRVAPLKTTSANLVDQVPPGSSVSFSRRYYSAHVRYRPDLLEQMKWSPKGIDGTFSIEYDVQRDDMYGDIALNDGYFAHFFAPPNLPPLPKIVVLVVDTSGSMYGYKIKQVIDALSSILRSLNSNDKFNLIFFGDEASSPMNGTVLEANAENIDRIVTEIQAIKAYGGTNMESAFDMLFDTFIPYIPEFVIVEPEESSGEEGSGLVPVVDESKVPVVDDSGMEEAEEEFLTKRDVESEIEYAKMAVFLTDGRPSIGETNTKALRKKVKGRNQNRISIHAIGLGSLVDNSFLEKLAHENSGTSRRIFEGINADVQIRNFFEEIANPVLKNVSFEYPSHKTKDLTETEFSVFLGGSELVVAGKVDRFGKQEPKSPEDISDDFDLIPVVPTPDASSANFIISGRVRGKKINDETEIIDFDLDLMKTSKIDDSQQKIKNYTEKLWAFLTLKKLLLDASIEENKTIKEDLNSQALNMSLKYGLVTPLTSLVVIKPKEREAIESQLREEAAKRTTTTPLPTTTILTPTPLYEYDISEDMLVDEPDIGPLGSFYEPLFVSRSRIVADYAYYVTPGSTAAATTTTTPFLYEETVFDRHSYEVVVRARPVVLAATTAPTKLVAYRGGSSGSGFSGDPHFVIPVKEGMKLCFNFDGKTGEIYNFLFDPTKQIVVNGMLLNSPAPPGGRRSVRTYVSHLAIMALAEFKNVLITPWNITIVESGMPNVTIPATSKFTLTKGGLEIKVIPSTKSTSTVTIDVKGLAFKVILNHRIRSPYSRDHIDFSLFNDLKSLSRGSDGVLGQFSDLAYMTDGSSAPTIVTTETGAGETSALLRLRSELITVTERTMPMPGSSGRTKCWYVHKNGADAMKKPKAFFKVPALFHVPVLTVLPF